MSGPVRKENSEIAWVCITFIWNSFQKNSIAFYDRQARQKLGEMYMIWSFYLASSSLVISLEPTRRILVQLFGVAIGWGPILSHLKRWRRSPGGKFLVVSHRALTLNMIMVLLMLRTLKSSIGILYWKPVYLDEELVKYLRSWKT